MARTIERIIVKEFYTPQFENLPAPLSLSNQFAYRPTSSTTAAIVSLLSHVTDLLETPQITLLQRKDEKPLPDTLLLRSHFLCIATAPEHQNQRNRTHAGRGPRCNASHANICVTFYPYRVYTSYIPRQVDDMCAWCNRLNA